MVAVTIARKNPASQKIVDLDAAKSSLI